MAVRGPLTAELIGQPKAAATDGAILMADVSKPPPPRSPSEVLFMPHHRSIRRTDWKRIAEEAGFTYVTPQQPTVAIMEAFSRAKLVVTEAMHGAIYADTLRIPWIPVSISSAFEEFKWRDWCMSMDVPFRPQPLRAGHGNDRREYAAMSRLLEKEGVAGHHNLVEVSDKQSIEAYFGKRFSPKLKDSLRSAVPHTPVNRLVNGALRLRKTAFSSQAVSDLRSAAHATPFLSRDTWFKSRLDQLRDAVGRAGAISASGQPST